MAAKISKRTKKAMGEKPKIHSDLFVVDNNRKDQANTPINLCNLRNLWIHFSSKHFWSADFADYTDKELKNVIKPKTF